MLRTKTILQIFFAGALFGAPALLGRSIGPPVPASGVPTDLNGQTCTLCHTSFPLNSDPTGRIRILTETMTYKPGVVQRIRISVEHPEAARWGFQITIRRAGDTAMGAGTLQMPSNPTIPNSGIQIRCGLSLGQPPCDGETQPQFAEHTTESTRAGTRNGVEWDIDWLPPANEVGDIVIFASGNAANNNGTNQGDRIYNTSVTLKAEGACNLARRPTVRSIGNAASYAREISPNAMASVFGMDFEVAGRTREVTAGDLVNGRFPTELACVSVEIGGVRAPISYVQTDQVNFQVPTGTPTGSVPLTVILNPGRPNELRSDQATVTVQNYAPAFFTFNNTSIAARDAVSGSVIALPATVAGGAPAARGSLVSLYGTGFGFSEPVYQAGEIAPGAPVRLRDPITVTVGGTTLPAADVQYAGLAPNFITGLQQINIRLPQSATGNVAITVTVGGVTTPAAGAVIPVQ